MKEYGKDCWGKKRLGQTGERGSRKKTNNKWFETQDSIGYWDDFNKPKICYSEIVREPQFYLDNDGKFYSEATSFLMNGKYLEYLIIMLHSKLLTFAFRTYYAGGGLGETGYRYKKAFLELLPVIIPTDKLERSLFTSTDYETEIYKMYDLSEEEKSYIVTS